MTKAQRIAYLRRRILDLEQARDRYITLSDRLESMYRKQLSAELKKARVQK